MTDFDYLSVLISIVLGLGIANTLSGIANIIRHRGRYEMFWPMPVALFTLFLIHVQTWWTMYGLRHETQWNLGGFLIVLAQPVLLFVMSVLLSPETPEGRRVDLKGEFFRDRVWFFSCL